MLNIVLNPRFFIRSGVNPEHWSVYAEVVVNHAEAIRDRMPTKVGWTILKLHAHAH